jgi:Spy/CpxP family protein refolding chaperone
MQENKIKYLTIGVLALAAINILLVSMMFLSPIKPQRNFKMKSDQRGFGENKGASFLIKKLDLSEDQSEDFKILFRQHIGKKDSLGKIIHQNKKQLARIVMESESDTTLINDTLMELMYANKQIELEMINHFKELKKICSPDQQTKLTKILQHIGKRQ